LLVQLVDVEKRAPGIVVGMIAADPQERWVVGYGRLSATDDRVPDGDTVFEIGSITKVFTGILLAQAVVEGRQHLRVFQLCLWSAGEPACPAGRPGRLRNAFVGTHHPPIGHGQHPYRVDARNAFPPGCSA